MIYVSSSCIKSNSLEESVRTLANEGFKNIELSGGTNFHEDTLDLLLELKEELGLNYLLHNYFPPPPKHFVLNLASLDDEIAQLTIDHLKKAIDWSFILGAKKYAFHAGFLLNIPLNQIGKKIKQVELFDEVEAYTRFNKNLMEIAAYADGKVELHIENNVLNESNYLSFNQIDPFFFTSSKNIDRIEWGKSFTLLLDVAHLKVSCHSLSLNFDEELENLYRNTDYIHISDNDGLVDSNQGLFDESEMFQSLNKVWKSGKTITIEVYSGMNDIKTTNKLLEKLNTV